MNIMRGIAYSSILIADGSIAIALFIVYRKSKEDAIKKAATESDT